MIRLTSSQTTAGFYYVDPEKIVFLNNVRNAGGDFLRASVVLEGSNKIEVTETSEQIASLRAYLRIYPSGASYIFINKDNMIDRESWGANIAHRGDKPLMSSEEAIARAWKERTA